MATIASSAAVEGALASAVGAAAAEGVRSVSRSVAEGGAVLVLRLWRCEAAYMLWLLGTWRWERRGAEMGGMGEVRLRGERSVAMASERRLRLESE